MAGGPTAIVCDDAPGFRALMSALLAEAGLDVVGEGETWDDAERLAPHAQVVVVDLWMPEFDAAALARVRATADGAVLVVVSALAPDAARSRLGAVHVDLLLAKSDPPAEIAEAIARRARRPEETARA